MEGTRISTVYLFTFCRYDQETTRHDATVERSRSVSTGPSMRAREREREEQTSERRRTEYTNLVSMIPRGMLGITREPSADEG